MFFQFSIFKRKSFSGRLSWYLTSKMDYYKLWKCPIFVALTLLLFTRYQNFLWGCWFLCKTVTDFGYPSWKLKNPADHNANEEIIACFLSYFFSNTQKQKRFYLVGFMVMTKLTIKMMNLGVIFTSYMT